MNTYALHHAAYGMPKAVELLFLVPMCGDHHFAAEFGVIQPSAGVVTRSIATLGYAVHGDELHRHPEWCARVIRRQEQHEQLSMWGSDRGF